MSLTTALRTWVTRTVVVASLVVLPVYLVWRVGWTSRGAFAPLFLALLIAEVASVVRFLTLVAPALPRAPQTPARGTTCTADIVVFVGAEPALQVRTAVQAALRVRSADRVVVLDTVGRADLERYCRGAGVARFVAPADALTVLRAEQTLLVPASHYLRPGAVVEMASMASGDVHDAVTGVVDVDQSSELVGASGYLLAADEDAAFARMLDRAGVAMPLYGPLLIAREALVDVAPIRWDPNRILLDLGIELQSRGGSVRPTLSAVAMRRPPSSEEAALRARARLADGRLRATRRSRTRALRPLQRAVYATANVELFSSATTLVAIVVPSLVALTGLLPLHISFVGAAVIGAPWLLLSGLARRLTDRRREPIGSHLRRVARTALVDLRVLGQHVDPVPAGRTVADLQSSTAMVLFGLCVSAALVPFTPAAMRPLPPVAGALVLVASLVVLWLARDVYLAIEDRQHRSMARFEQAGSPEAVDAGFMVRTLSPLGFDADTAFELEPGQRIGVTVAIPEADGSVVDRQLLGVVMRVATRRGVDRVYVEFEPDERRFDELLYFVSVTAPRLREEGVEFHVVRDLRFDVDAPQSLDEPVRLDLRWLHDEIATLMPSELLAV